MSRIARRLCFLCVPVWLTTCTKDKGVRIEGSRYPDDVAKIIVAKCAVQGCHTPASRHAAGRLSLSTWNELFEGSATGAVVVPYSPAFSTLLYFTNTFPEFGTSLSPQMPLNGTALSKDEIKTLRDWILAGSPDKSGAIRFREGTGRKKLYICNRLCDLVMVLDAESGLQSACVETGVLQKTEFPVCVKVSPDRRHWFCTSLASTVFRKFSAESDVPDGQADLGEGVWTSFAISSDNRFAYCVDKSAMGTIAVVDLHSMRLISRMKNEAMVYPSDVAITADNRFLFLGSETGNYITRVDLGQPGTPEFRRIALDGSNNPTEVASLETSIVTYDGEFVYAGCSGTGEVIRFDPRTSAASTICKLPAAPSSISFDSKSRRLWITCMSDSLSFPGKIGSVRVVDIQSGVILKTIHAGTQSTAIGIEIEHGYALVVNANLSEKGPAPHHPSGCAGRNGYATFVDLETLDLIPGKKTELAVFPSACAVR